MAGQLVFWFYSISGQNRDCTLNKTSSR